jgi:hypothetical protein
VAYVRTVRTASGATAVQVVWSSRRGSRRIEHVGSAHDEAELAALKSVAAGRRTGWSIKRFVQTARRYRTIAIRTGGHVLTAEQPLPADLRDALAVIT